LKKVLEGVEYPPKRVTPNTFATTLRMGSSYQRKQEELTKLEIFPSMVDDHHPP
jgi:hypothetical protein